MLGRFPGLLRSASMKRTDMCNSALFSFLGWKLAEDKLIDRRHSGNFASRRLRGRLQFANTHLFGGSMKRSLGDLSRHIASGRKDVSEDIVNALGKFQLGFVSQQSTPRVARFR